MIRGMPTPKPTLRALAFYVLSTAIINGTPISPPQKRQKLRYLRMPWLAFCLGSWYWNSLTKAQSAVVFDVTQSLPQIPMNRNSNEKELT